MLVPVLVGIFVLDRRRLRSDDRYGLAMVPFLANTVSLLISGCHYKHVVGKHVSLHNLADMFVGNPLDSRCFVFLLRFVFQLPQGVLLIF